MSPSCSSSRPIIFLTSSMRGSSSVRYSPTNRPLRKMVMRSAISYTWSRKWVTNRMASPCALRWRMTSNSLPTSSRSSEDVGSSRMSNRDEMLRARAIATSCWMAMEYDPSGFVTSSRTLSRSRSSASAARFTAFQEILPNVRGSRPRTPPCGQSPARSPSSPAARRCSPVPWRP